MTIKQQGGVFGRNPSFNDVDANQVTANTANVADLVVSNSSSFKGNMAFKNSAGTQMAFIAPSLGGSFRLQGQSAEPMTFWINNVQVGEFNNSRDFKINNGNLVIGTSGKGIDFSATSGTGTSELFDDYEEGTFSPTFSAEFTTAPTVTSAQYTKFGRQVTVTILAINGIVTAGGSIGGLPFTSNAAQGSGAYGGNSDTTLSLQGTIGQSASSITNIPARVLTSATWQITATYFTA